jgi:hypothetical protein
MAIGSAIIPDSAGVDAGLSALAQEALSPRLNTRNGYQAMKARMSNAANAATISAG